MNEARLNTKRQFLENHWLDTWNLTIHAGVRWGCGTFLHIPPLIWFSTCLYHLHSSTCHSIFLYICLSRSEDFLSVAARLSLSDATRTAEVSSDKWRGTFWWGWIGALCPEKKKSLFSGRRKEKKTCCHCCLESPLHMPFRSVSQGKEQTLSVESAETFLMPGINGMLD